MAVKIRLTRMGKKKQPSYRVVVVDSRKSRDSAYIEQIGRYDPRQEPSVVEIDNDRALDWLEKGAQPTERAQKLLEISGAWGQFRVNRGEIHTVGGSAAAASATAAAAAVADEGAEGGGHVPEVHVVGGDAPVVEDAADTPTADTPTTDTPTTDTTGDVATGVVAVEDVAVEDVAAEDIVSGDAETGEAADTPAVEASATDSSESAIDEDAAVDEATTATAEEQA